MPRDTVLLESLITDPFEKIGIIPVPMEFVAKYRKDYAATHKRPGYRDYWVSSMLYQPHVAASLRCLFTIGRNYLTIANPAPKVLIALAEHVYIAEPKATFEVATFLYDPILYATIKRKRRCLGIWDKGELIAIATRI